MATLQENNSVRHVGLVMQGMIPGLGGLLDTIGVNTFTELPNVSQLQNLETVIENIQQFQEQFDKLYPGWKNQRKEVIDQVREKADNIEWHHRNTNIAQIPTSLIGIGGGVLSITGLALIPVTFGASLALTITGAVVGVGASVAGIANSATDIAVKIHRHKRAKALLNEHKHETAKLQSVVNALTENSKTLEGHGNAEIQSVLNELQVMNGGEAARVGVTGLKSSAAVLAKTIPKAAKLISLLRKSIGTTATAGTTSIRTADIAADVAGGAAKAAASTGAKVMRGFGFAFSAIGIAVDVVTIGATTYDLAKGSKTKVSDKLRSVADQLEEELKIMEQIKTALDDDDCEDLKEQLMSGY